MTIYCHPADYEAALAVVNAAQAAGIQVNLQRKEDSYALTVWSVEDIAGMDDERAADMSDAEKEEFLAYAEDQLHDDMVARGWESPRTLLDEYLEEKASSEVS